MSERAPIVKITKAKSSIEQQFLFLARKINENISDHLFKAYKQKD